MGFVLGTDVSGDKGSPGTGMGTTCAGSWVRDAGGGWGEIAPEYGARAKTGAELGEVRGEA
ncbi:hypothetical protein QS257_18980 [Terrilactibacillus sp. S3-3]|nr:hypothetical protein QS257_18980 [Terrilactibacillus sp. S3-3]